MFDRSTPPIVVESYNRYVEFCYLLRAQGGRLGNIILPCTCEMRHLSTSPLSFPVFPLSHRQNMEHVRKRKEGPMGREEIREHELYTLGLFVPGSQ